MDRLLIEKLKDAFREKLVIPMPYSDDKIYPKEHFLGEIAELALNIVTQHKHSEDNRIPLEGYLRPDGICVVTKYGDAPTRNSLPVEEICGFDDIPIPTKTSLPQESTQENEFSQKPPI